jgi:hypothetical protein
MKKIIIGLLCSVFLQLSAQDKIVNDENVEKRTITSFKDIKVSDGIELFLSQGAEESVAVSASEQKYLVLLKTEVENQTLKIYFSKKDLIWNDNSKRKLKVYVSFKQLSKLQASSGANVKATTQIKVPQLSMDFSSGANFNGELNVVELEAVQSSGAEIEATGKAENLKVEASSGAIFKAFDLQVDICDAKATSGGSVRVLVNKELVAKANSGGGIRYKGAAVIKNIDISSGGLVKKA